MGYGPDAISAMERGVRTPQPELLEKTDEILDAGGLLKEVIPEVKEAMAKARTRHPEWYRDYAGLEAEAVSLYDYSTMGVLGLLQTADYARPCSRNGTRRWTRKPSRSGWPTGSPGSSSSRSGRRRNAASSSNRPYWSGRSRRGFGARRAASAVAAHREHAERTASSDATARIQHPCLGGSFTLLIPKGKEQVAYMEIQGYPRSIIDREKVRILADCYGVIQAQALTPDEPLDLIEKMLEER